MTYGEKLSLCLSDTFLQSSLAYYLICSTPFPMVTLPYQFTDIDLPLYYATNRSSLLIL
jgi:hypothetical protein